MILLLTDGDDFGGDPVASAALVRESKVQLLVAGVGTTEGATIPVVDPETQQETPKLGVDDVPIVTKLNEPFLRAIATASGGRYLGSDLSVVPGAVDGRIRALESARIEERPTILPIERYQVFAATALALLVLAALAERFVRFPWRAGAALAALALLLGGCASTGYETNEAGREALKNGDTGLAIEKFLQAQVEKPDDPEIALNLAAAYAAAGRHDEAIRSARRAVASNRPETRSRAYSSIGHHQFALERLPDALDAFRRSLLEDPDNDGARHDYEVVLRLLYPDVQPTPPPEQQPGEGDGTATAPAGTPNGSPAPGSSSGPGGQQTPVPGTPTPGGGSGSGTPTPGSAPGRPTNLEDLERQLEDINGQVERIMEDGQELTTAEAYEVLRLLAERSRIAQLRNGLQGGGGPRVY
jgi:Ca-activated chloride channel family protein